MRIAPLPCPGKLPRAQGRVPGLTLALGILFAGAANASEEWVLGEISVRTGDIYSEASARRSTLRRLINGTHWTTREAVIRREIWRSEGDLVDGAFAEELERNLRATGLFAKVSVELVPGSAEGVRNLEVITQDKLSLGGGAGASFVGNASSGSVSLSESNVLGMGDRLRFSVTENDFGETRGSVAYRDRYLAGTWTTATVSAGRAEEGNFFGLGLERPFRFLEDRFAWSARAGTTSVDQDYFFSNTTVAEVPFDLASAEASARWRQGTRMDFWSRGLVARHESFDYRSARGPAAGSLRVPGDTDSTFAGATLGWANIERFEKVQGLDTLRFVQDIQVGTIASLEAGAVWRDEAGSSTSAGSSVQPRVAASVSKLIGAGSSRFARLGLSGRVRTLDGEATGWSSTLDVRAFELSFRPHTLALSATYTEAEESENLPIQLTLGESSGLRGYPNREFTGQRFVRLNLEDRIDLDASFRSLDFGAVIFADAAWIGDRGADLEGPFTSAGVGLRIGSTELFGAGVLRLDFAVPFDDANGESFDPLVSFTLGQVFTL